MYHTFLQKVSALLPLIYFVFRHEEGKRQNILHPLFYCLCKWYFFLFGKLCIIVYFKIPLPGWCHALHIMRKNTAGIFFFPYFPENVVLQLLASCIHKQRTDATAFNSSLDPLSPRGMDFFFFFLKDTICERFNVISTWSPHQLCVYHQALKFLWFSLSEWTKYEVFSS